MKRLTIVLLILNSISGIGQKEGVDKLDSLILTKMNEYRVLGLSIGIVKDGKSFYTRGYGYTSSDSLYTVDKDTRFELASITKLFTTTLVMQLAEQGLLNIHKPIIEYIPEFKLKDNRYKDITTYQLLTHSSGLPWDSELKERTNDSIALQELVISLRKTKLNFEPGSKFDGSTYSNTGYDILGYLIQRISKMPFENYVQNTILNKLEMNHTTYYTKNIPEYLLAQPLKIEGKSKEIKRFNLYGEIKDLNPIFKYPEIPIVRWLEDDLVNKPEHYPSSHLHSSSYDLNKWLVEYLDIYNKNRQEILSSSTVKEMWSLQRDIKERNTSIGLGWWRFSNSDNGNYVFHVGREPGYCSTLRIYPDKNIGIVILSNAYYASELVWNELPELIMDILNDEK